MSNQVVTIREMMEVGVHFGHSTRFRNPEMEDFIYGINNKINIINLEKTQPLFTAAMQCIKKVIGRGGKVLFVGTKKQARKLIAEYADKCGMPYVDHRWLGGMLTNYKTIKQSIRRMNELEKMQEDGMINKLTKKEGLNVIRKFSKLECGLKGIKNMSGLPDALFVIDVGHEHIAVREANRLGIPVVGVVDTNSSPKGVDYIIPGNDDAIKAIKFYIEKVTETILATQETQNAATLNAKYQEEFVELQPSDAKKKRTRAKKENKEPKAGSDSATAE